MEIQALSKFTQVFHYVNLFPKSDQDHPEILPIPAVLIRIKNTGGQFWNFKILPQIIQLGLLFKALFCQTEFNKYIPMIYLNTLKRIHIQIL